jgi:endonuclease/exonuclease/phosphatase (EEP) superfamily protein YafD
MLFTDRQRVHLPVIWHIVAWSVLALLAAAAVTATFEVSSRKLLALAHDALPYVLILAWPITVLSIVAGAWPLACAGAVLIAYHLALMIPRIRSDQVPRWVTDAPRFDLTVANVYVDNETPGDLATEIIGGGADVVVIAEWNDRFGAEFDAAGAELTYPHRLCNECDNEDYIVTVASRLPLEESSRVVPVGPLIITHAVITCGSRPVGVIAVHPTAVVDPGGYDEWKAQLEALLEYIRTVDGPFVIAGDFNSTRFRPEFQRLLDLGLIDAHDTLGRGLSASFRLAATGALAAAGTIVRLDHALLSDGVWPVMAKDLESCGSDHVPFTVTLAVRPDKTGHPRGAHDAAMSRSTM